MTPIHLRNVPPPSETFDHVGFLTLMASWIKPTKYLELEVRCGKNFCSISQFCEKAIGVDVIFHNFPLKENMEFFEGFTDDYFSKLPSDEMFDMVFIDADKEKYLNYNELIVPKKNRGGIILSDNVLWSGKVVEPLEPYDLSTKVLVEYNVHLKNDPRVETVLLPIRDGLTVSRVL
jgi:predicted O-methyltransferase YrrM